MRTELQRRLQNLSDAHAIAALNRSIKWIERQSGYLFMAEPTPALIVVTSRTPPEQAAIGSMQVSFDPSKGKMVFNVDGTPVQHMALSDLWMSSNYNIPGQDIYDGYAIATDYTANPPLHTFYFTPNVSGSVFIYYHRAHVDIADSPSSFSGLPAEFDDLIVDLAEAEERRVYDIGDSWQLLLGRCQDQIKVLIDGFRSESQQAAQVSDATVKVQEATQIGRT